MSESVTITQECGCGNVYVIINKDRSIAVHLAKKGTCAYVISRVITTMANMMLQVGYELEDIIECISNLHCNKYRKKDENCTIWSCADAVSHAIKYYLKNNPFDGDTQSP